MLLEEINPLHKDIRSFVVGSYYKVLPDNEIDFLEYFRRFSLAEPLTTNIQELKGEIFLTDRAFNMLVRYDSKLVDLYYPEIIPSSNIVGFVNVNNQIKRVRTTAIQRSIHKNFEGLIDGQMELRLFQ